MKKNILTVLFILAIFVILLLSKYPQTRTESSSVPVNSNIPYDFTAKATSSQENSGINVMASKTDIYTVKEYEGRIGIFLNDSTAPYQQLDVDVSSLQETDQKLLKEGIKVYSTEKLNSIIEDYES